MSRRYTRKEKRDNGAPAYNDKPRGKKKLHGSNGDETSMLNEADRSLTGSNDISWYSKYPSLLAAAGSIPYPVKPGMTLNLGSIESQDYSAVVMPVKEGIPGVACLDWIPSVGRSTDVLSPASVTCKELWAKIRQSYGSTQLAADPPDLLMYLMSLDSIFAYIGWLKSVYRSLDAFTPTNHNLPEGLLYAKGFSMDQIQVMRENRTNLWYAINTLIHYTWKFTCPDVMAVFKRHYWLSENVFTDAQTSSAQLYMFNLRAVFKFALLPIPSNPEVQAGGLELVSLDVAQMGTSTIVQDLFTFGQQLVSALAESEDGYTIAGYFARAFDGVPSFTVSELAVDEVIKLQYSPEVLSQIENSTGLANSNWAVFDNYLKGNVYQEPSSNSIIHTPGVVSGIGKQLAGVTPWVSIRSDAPTVQDTVIATRLKVGTTKVSNSEYALHCGTEVPWCWRYWWKEVDRLGDSEVHPGWRWLASSAVEVVFRMNTDRQNEIASHIVECMCMKSQWDWAPIVVMGWSNHNISGMNAFDFVSLVGDTHNITALPLSALDELHRVCLYSEFSSFDF